MNLFLAALAHEALALLTGRPIEIGLSTLGIGRDR